MTTGTHGLPVQSLFGIPIAAVTPAEVIGLIERRIDQRQRLYIGVVNAAKVVNMQRDEALRLDVLASDIVLADGMSVVWASRVLGAPLPTRVTGIDLMYDMLGLADARGFKVYCLGATPEILATVMATVRRNYPNAKLVGGRDGYFKMKDADTVLRDIAAADPDMLFVAMTSPKKEQFLALANGTLAVPVLHGVGGSFDVMAGKVERAPLAWQRLGLEWLYRVKQEPGRLWRRYLVTNALFCMLVARQLAGRVLNRPSAPAGAGAPTNR